MNIRVAFQPLPETTYTTTVKGNVMPAQVEQPYPATDGPVSASQSVPVAAQYIYQQEGDDQANKF